MTDLHCESYGDPAQPLLLLIPGGNGDAGPYAPLAHALSGRFRVIAYDRRGFSRSQADEVPADRLAFDVEDAVALLDDAGAERAHVFGSSSGAIVGLRLLQAHPGRVASLIAHEPPLISALPDRDKWAAQLDDVVARYRSDGVVAAMAMFNEAMGMAGGALPPADLVPPHVRDMIERMLANQAFWLEHEVRQYPMAELDMGALAAHRDRLTLAGGRQSRDHMPYLATAALAGRLGLDVVDMPGDHIGYVTDAAEFSPVLSSLLPDC